MIDKLKTTDRIGPPKPARPPGQSPTLQERNREEGVKRPLARQSQPLKLAPGQRFVNRPGHVLQPMVGAVEPPATLTAADSLPPDQRGRFGAHVLKPAGFMGKLSPITRAKRPELEQAQPPAPKGGTMTLAERVEREGMAAYGKKFAEASARRKAKNAKPAPAQPAKDKR